MKAIVVPYHDMHNCLWAGEFFPGRSIASLPVCGKPIIEYELDECSRLGIVDVLILDWGYDSRLAIRLGDGSKWGIHLLYTGENIDLPLVEQLQRHAGFIGDDDVKFFLENKIGEHKIISLKTYFEANFKILRNPGNLVLPGYSSESGVYMGMNVVIKPEVEISSPVFLGDNSYLERGVHVSEGAIIGENVLIGRETTIRQSVIFEGTCLGRTLNVDGKIVLGNRIIDPETRAYVDVEDAGLSTDMDYAVSTKPMPVSQAELSMFHYTANQDPQTEKEIANALSDLALDITALNLRKLKGVYLGGGYGRGEGGAPLYNDLDFFVLTDNATEAEKDRIQVMLGTAAVKYSSLLGVDVDFCRPKNASDFRKVEKRLMTQELLRGNVPIYGKTESLNFLKRYPAGLIPVAEALRLLVNRGMGLLLARKSTDRDFVKRNINKAVLGAGDARLIAEGRYAWTIRMRAVLLKNEEYDRAVQFKCSPRGDVTTWSNAYAIWLDAVERVVKLRRHSIKRPSILQAVRWVARRHTLGDLKTFGQDPLYRILVPLKKLLAEGENGSAIPESLMTDWRIFN